MFWNSQQLHAVASRDFSIGGAGRLECACPLVGGSEPDAVACPCAPENNRTAANQSALVAFLQLVAHTPISHDSKSPSFPCRPLLTALFLSIGGIIYRTKQKPLVGRVGGSELMQWLALAGHIITFLENDIAGDSMQ